MAALSACGSDEYTEAGADLRDFESAAPPDGPGEADATVAAARGRFGNAVKPGAVSGYSSTDGLLTPTWHGGQPRSVEVTLPTRSNGRWSVRDRASRLSMEVALVGASDRPAALA